MTFDKLDQKIEELKKERQNLFLASLPMIGRHEDDARKVYGVQSLLAIAAIFFTVFVFYDVVDDIVMRVAQGLFILVALVGALQYIALLEKHQGVFHDVYNFFVKKYGSEIAVLERFRNGMVDGEAIRQFYLDQAGDAKAIQKLHKTKMHRAWTLTVLLGVGIVLVVLAL